MSSGTAEFGNCLHPTGYVRPLHNKDHSSAVKSLTRGQPYLVGERVITQINLPQNLGTGVFKDNLVGRGSECGER